MHNLATLQQLLLTPQRVVILPHVKPDADALGSALALALCLRKLGHKATVISPTDYPKFLYWLPGQEGVINFEHHAAEARVLFQEATLIACVDFSDIKRLDELQTLIETSSAKRLLVDHHRGKTFDADFELWDIEAAATCELVYDLLVMLGQETNIDLEIAANIYAGIMTDTGSFKFPSTSAKIHRIVANLKDKGLDTFRIHQYVYDTSSENRLKLLGYALSQKLRVLYEYRTAYFELSEEELRQFNAQTGDTEGLVNYALSIEGVCLAVLFVQKENYVKMSFRSSGDFNVSELAGKHFNGGGHKNAAGGRLNETTLKATTQLFLSLLPQYQAQLLQS